MEKKSIIIGSVIGIVVAVIIFGILIGLNVLSFKDSDNIKTKNGNVVNEETVSEEEVKILPADEYVTLEDVQISSTITTKKVKFQNIDDSLTSVFYNEQEKLIEEAKKNVQNGAINEEYDLKYFVNNGILSVLYTIVETNAIGTCANRKIVTNIDLKEKKLVSQEELLKSVGKTYSDVVSDWYDEELDNWTNMNNSNGHVVSYDASVTYDDFKNNKQKYVDKGMERIASDIYVYIENNEVKYDYYSINSTLIFHSIGKGGCFDWNSKVLGKYNG